ncbi:unnamed protein product [Ixodes pacificus]
MVKRRVPSGPSSNLWRGVRSSSSPSLNLRAAENAGKYHFTSGRGDPAIRAVNRAVSPSGTSTFSSLFKKHGGSPLSAFSLQERLESA